jgi:hypothetical protein
MCLSKSIKLKVKMKSHKLLILNRHINNLKNLINNLDTRKISLNLLLKFKKLNEFKYLDIN